MQQNLTGYHDDALCDMNWLTNLQPTNLNRSRSNPYCFGQSSQSDHVNRNQYYCSQRQSQSSSRGGISEPPPEEVIIMNRKYVKPPYSYAKLITMAIDSTTDKKMLLKDIYDWVETKYPFYKYTSNKGWKVSTASCILLINIGCLNNSTIIPIASGNSRLSYRKFLKPFLII